MNDVTIPCATTAFLGFVLLSFLSSLVRGSACFLLCRFPLSLACFLGSSFFFPFGCTKSLYLSRLEGVACVRASVQSAWQRGSVVVIVVYSKQSVYRVGVYHRAVGRKY